MTTTVLYAPSSYITVSEEVKRVINGCGPQGWKGKLIPETIWGLSIREACNIHDWMYHIGETIEDKREADRVFLDNCLRLIDAKKSFSFVAKRRRNRAYKYYRLVSLFGGPFFWKEKNPSDTMLFVAV